MYCCRFGIFRTLLKKLKFREHFQREWVISLNSFHGGKILVTKGPGSQTCRQPKFISLYFISNNVAPTSAISIVRNIADIPVLCLRLPLSLANENEFELIFCPLKSLWHYRRKLSTMGNRSKSMVLGIFLQVHQKQEGLLL